MLIKNVWISFPTWMIRFVADFDFLARVFQNETFIAVEVDY